MGLEISKEKINELPIEIFEGEIIVIDKVEDVASAVDYLKQFEVIGFDTETKPVFKNDLICSKDVMKIGLSLRDDFAALRKRTDCPPLNFRDLQDIVHDYGIKDLSLQKIYAILFEKKISKNQRLSNWEAKTLKQSQKMYAAIDAWACLKIYNHLINNGTHKTEK